ncbi:hypothetical protein [Actinomadura sp. 9N407]
MGALSSGPPSGRDQTIRRAASGNVEGCDPVWQAYAAATGTVVASVAL